MLCSPAAPPTVRILHPRQPCNLQEERHAERVFTIREGATLELQCLVTGHPRPQVRGGASGGGAFLSTHLPQQQNLSILIVVPTSVCRASGLPGGDSRLLGRLVAIATTEHFQVFPLALVVVSHINIDVGANYL